MPGLRLPEPRLGLAGGVEEFRTTVGQRQVSLVLLLRLTARLRPAGDPRSHDPIAYADHAYPPNAGQARAPRRPQPGARTPPRPGWRPSSRAARRTRRPP